MEKDSIGMIEEIGIAHNALVEEVGARYIIFDLFRIAAYGNCVIGAEPGVIDIILVIVTGHRRGGG